jgi:hypothetical protein
MITAPWNAQKRRVIVSADAYIAILICLVITTYLNGVHQNED